MIPYGRQSISAADIEAVTQVLQSDWLTQGPVVQQFEQAIADYCGAAHAVAVSSGTAALHLACLVLGLGPGDSLWTSPNTFVASANCARYCGADVDFVDIDSRTFNISVSALSEKLEVAKAQGKLPKVVVVVHFAGQPCEMKALAELAKQYGFYLIEDAAHAIGGKYGNAKVGSCQYSDLTTFSFHPVKLITSGEGGMVSTNNAELKQRLQCLCSHGITRNPQQMQGDDAGQGWYYEQHSLGFNYRMCDIQAALGLSQLQRLDEFVSQRRALAKRYDVALAGLPLSSQYQLPDSSSAWHLYVIRLQLEDIAPTRRQVFERLRKAGIGVHVHYIPMHTQPYYQNLGFKPGDFPEAETYYDAAITLPLFPAMSEAQQDAVTTALREALG
jgi:UDP-4-amino-4,6-dideoxy-N-acetyl-beta-L-altrosamine transaminase